MAASEALSMQGEPPPTPADSAVAEAAAVTDTVAAATRWPQLIPIAQLLAVVLGVLAIIWNQQQTTDTLRTELSTVEAALRAEISTVEAALRAEISSVETALRAEISQLRVEVDGVETELGNQISSLETALRAEISENGERLARIEGFLGIGMPDEAPVSPE